MHRLNAGGVINHRPGTPAWLADAYRDRPLPDSLDAMVYAVTAPRRVAAAAPVEPMWRRALRGVVDGPARFRALLQLLVATWWLALAGALAAVTFGQAAAMLAAGDAVYASPGYHLLRDVPGGMRTYGLLLLLLGVATAIGYGQARAGAGGMLRLCLSLLAGWYVLWLVALVGTWALDLVVYSVTEAMLAALAAFVSVLVAAAVPPDRG